MARIDRRDLESMAEAAYREARNADRPMYLQPTYNGWALVRSRHQTAGFSYLTIYPDGRVERPGIPGHTDATIIGTVQS